MPWEQLSFDILSEFASHAALAHDREWTRETDRAALLAERRKGQRRYPVDPEANRAAARRWYARHRTPVAPRVTYCKHAGCIDVAHRIGLCDRHYFRVRRIRIEAREAAREIGVSLTPEQIEAFRVEYATSAASCAELRARYGLTFREARALVGASLRRRRHSANRSGERHAMARLTAEDVREIRRRRLAGELPGQIAAPFGVTPKHVWRICRGECWA